MYKNNDADVAVGSVALMSLGFCPIRSQLAAGDVAWMSAMIPQHSIAKLTSERAKITEFRVTVLAAKIIAAQYREIGAIKALIKDFDVQSAGASHQ